MSSTRRSTASRSRGVDGDLRRPCARGRRSGLPSCSASSASRSAGSRWRSTSRSAGPAAGASERGEPAAGLDAVSWPLSPTAITLTPARSACARSCALSAGRRHAGLVEQQHGVAQRSRRPVELRQPARASCPAGMPATSRSSRAARAGRRGAEHVASPPAVGVGERCASSSSCRCRRAPGGVDAVAAGRDRADGRGLVGVQRRLSARPAPASTSRPVRTPVARVVRRCAPSRIARSQREQLLGREPRLAGRRAGRSARDRCVAR